MLFNGVRPNHSSAFSLQKRRKVKPADTLTPAIKERIKKVFNECYKAVQNCEEPGTGRRRWELFRELPDKRVCLTGELPCVYS